MPEIPIKNLVRVRSKCLCGLLIQPINFREHSHLLLSILSIGEFFEEIINISAHENTFSISDTFHHIVNNFFVPSLEVVESRKSGSYVVKLTIVVFEDILREAFLISFEGFGRSLG